MCADCVAWLCSQLLPDSLWPSSSASLLHNTNIMLSKITSIFFALAMPFVWYVYFQRVSTANRREQPRPPSVFGVHTVVYMCSCVYMTTRAMFRWSIHSWSDWMTQGAYVYVHYPWCFGLPTFGQGLHMPVQILRKLCKRMTRAHLNFLCILPRSCAKPFEE